MKLCKVLSLILSITPIIFAHPNDYVISQPIDESIILGDIITKFYIQYFTDSQVFVSITTPSSKKYEYFMHDFFSNLFDDPTITILTYNILDILDNSIHSYRRAFHLVIIGNSGSLSDILNKTISVKQFHMAQKFLIVVIEKVQNPTESLDEMYKILWKNGLINSHVLIQDDNKSWSLFSFLPYQNSCTTLTSLKLATYAPFNLTNDLKLSIDELYPQKLKNFNKCPVYITTSNTKPFVISYNNSHGNHRVEGIDILILKQIAKIHNFTAIYKGLNNIADPGTVFENGTATGSLLMVLKREANLTVGGYLLSPLRSKVLSPSNPFMHVSFGFAYKKDGSQIVSLTEFTAPFQFNLWLILSVILLSTTFLILMTKKLSRKWRHFYIGGRLNHSPILNMWLSLLGKSIPNRYIASGRNLGNFARTLLFLWMILWFVIRSCFEGTLFNKFQSNRIESPFDTVEKVQASNCNILATPTIYPTVAHLLPKNRFLEKDSESFDLLQYYYEHNDEINGVVLMNHLTCRYFNLKNPPYRQISFTIDQLFTYKIVYYFPKQSPFEDLFNVKLQELQDAGLLSHYVKKYDEHKSKNYQKSYSKFQIYNLFAALKMCAIMYLISFIVFILEIVSVKFKRLEYFIDFFTY